MKVIVCCKVVPDSQDVAVENGALALPTAHWKISDYDLQALHAGVEIAQATDGSAVALNAGSSVAAAPASKKDVLSRGVDELYQVVDESLQDADTKVLSETLAAAIDRIGADVVVCGEGSADRYCQQTAIALGEALGWPSVNCVSSIAPGDGMLTLERQLEDCIEELEVPLPAVVAVTSDINKPTLPGMRAILAASKKPQHDLPLEELGAPEPAVETIGVEAPPEPDRKKVMLEGSADEAAAQLVALLKQDGIL